MDGRINECMVGLLNQLSAAMNDGSETHFLNKCTDWSGSCFQ